MISLNGSSKHRSPLRDEISRIGPFIFEKLLGVGQSSKVYKGKHIETGLDVAIKTYNKSSLYNHPDVKNRTEKEVAILKIVDHPNIVQLYDVFETKTHIFLIMEYVGGGTLFDYVSKMESLDVDETQELFAQLIAGLSHCHEHNICHRDLKLENLLLSSDFQTLKLADFGLSSVVWKSKYFDTPCGSIHYSPPEVLCSGQPYNGYKADIWSCGIILYTMLTGRFPFDGSSTRDIVQNIKLGNFVLPRHIPWETKDLLRRLLCEDPKRRFTMRNVCEHPWIKQSIPNFGTCKVIVAKESILDVNIAIIEMMHVLGYPKAILMEQLALEGLNLAKILYTHMLSTKHFGFKLSTLKGIGEVKSRDKNRFRSSSNPEAYISAVQSFVPFTKEEFKNDIVDPVKQKRKPRKEESKLPYIVDQYVDSSFLLFNSYNGRELEVALRGGRRDNKMSPKPQKDQVSGLNRKRSRQSTPST